MIRPQIDCEPGREGEIVDLACGERLHVWPMSWSLGFWDPYLVVAVDNVRWSLSYGRAKWSATLPAVPSASLPAVQRQASWERIVAGIRGRGRQA